MVLAVGRLELQVTMAMRAEDHHPSGRDTARPGALERAYDRAQLERVVEANRNHWMTVSSLTGPRLP